MITFKKCLISHTCVYIYTTHSRGLCIFIKLYIYINMYHKSIINVLKMLLNKDKEYYNELFLFN